MLPPLKVFADQSRQHFTPEKIKAGTLHSTNKVFERYLQCKPYDAIEIYKKASEKATIGVLKGNCD